jgi:hypothetical protein
VLLSELSIDGVTVEASYADVFVVVRAGADGPSQTDWEVNVRTPAPLRLPPGRHDLDAVSADGHALSGTTALRFSDGQQHLFRGDGPLAGVAALLA